MSGDILKAKIKDLYLNPDGADFWFVFGDEKIPGHKFVLATMSPWLNTMFNGSLPVEREANMSNYDVTVEAFKEFLKFPYLGEVNFTMDNIEEIISLAKMSLNDDFFVECENFLIKSLTTENMFLGYKLSSLYEANRLKRICEEEISFNADKVLKSSSFLDFPYELLESLLKCDTLTCEEKNIFDACIAWAKASCERNGKDPFAPENIRAQLRDSIYQIRFNSMTIKEAADCISSFRRLFTYEELEEIIFMVGRKSEVQTKKFNWTERNLRIQRKNQRKLTCSRFKFSNYVLSHIFHYPNVYPVNRTNTLYIFHDFNLIERTTFTSGKLLMLNGFTCEGFYCGYRELEMRFSVNVRISKINPNNDDDIDELFSQQMMLSFTGDRKCVGYHPHKMAHVELKPAVLIRPKCKYTIEIQFQAQPFIRNTCLLKRRVRVDHNIVIQFDSERGAISSLNIGRVKEENYFKKLCHNPYMYLMIFGISYMLLVKK